jgi:hypothetical protein
MASKRKIRQIIAGFAASGMTRREYCEKHSIAVTTLDYWRRRQKMEPRLVEVVIEAPPAATGFALVLANGRRIESSWRFNETDLERLIRVAEA